MERLLEWSGYFLHSVLKTAVSWSSGNEQDAWKRLLDLYDKEVKKKKTQKTKTWMMGFYLSKYGQEWVGIGVITVP